MTLFKKLLSKVFNSREYSHFVCFKIENYEEIYQIDQDVITKLEENFLAAGAFPAKIDFPSKLCCVSIYDSTVKPEDIQQVIEALGFRARIIEEESKEE